MTKNRVNNYISTEEDVIKAGIEAEEIAESVGYSKAVRKVLKDLCNESQEKQELEKEVNEILKSLVIVETGEEWLDKYVGGLGLHHPAYIKEFAKQFEKAQVEFYEEGLERIEEEGIGVLLNFLRLPIEGVEEIIEKIKGVRK